MSFSFALVQYHTHAFERAEGVNVGVVMVREHEQKADHYWRSEGPESAMFSRVLTSCEHLAARSGKPDLDTTRVREELDALRLRLQERAEYPYYKADLLYRTLECAERAAKSRFAFIPARGVPGARQLDDPEPHLARLFGEYVSPPSLSGVSRPARIPSLADASWCASAGRLALLDVRYCQFRTALRAVLRDGMFGGVSLLRDKAEQFQTLRAGFMAHAHDVLRAVVENAPERALTFQRAAGTTLCDVCGTAYRDHPSCMQTLDVDSMPWLTQLCDGRLVKL